MFNQHCRSDIIYVTFAISHGKISTLHLYRILHIIYTISYSLYNIDYMIPSAISIALWSNLLVCNWSNLTRNTTSGLSAWYILWPGRTMTYGLWARVSSLKSLGTLVKIEKMYNNMLNTFLIIVDIVYFLFNFLQ